MNKYMKTYRDFHRKSDFLGHGLVVEKYEFDTDFWTKVVLIAISASFVIFYLIPFIIDQIKK